MKSIFIFTLVLMLTGKSYAVDINKQDWLNAINSELPAALCDSSTYYRQCFTVSAQKCEAIAASTTEKCLKNNEKNIPNILDQPKDGTHWGSIVGACAGQAYEDTLTEFKISNKKCNNAANWQ
ncbi:MAG TPA: hypothetical protein DCE52_01750 [Rhodobacteraceae bacterium]|nr:hypothetical protein [Paracoccaceae bacterium]